MDLNLIRTFVAIYEARSLTVTAERLFVTQPAVSHALGRLRREFEDPLFVKAGRLMQPTELAQSIYPELRGSLLRIDKVVDDVHGFDPFASVRRFRVALSELGEIAYAPAIVAAVRERAPDASLEIVPLNVGLASEWLTSGAADLVIASTPIAGDFESTVIKTTRYVALGDAEHSPVGAPVLTFDAYRDADHVVVSGDSGFPVVELALRRAGLDVTPAVVVSRFSALPRLLAGSSLVAVVPDNVAVSWTATRPLAMRELPLPVDRVDVCLYKRATSHNRAALDWLFTVAQNAVRDSSHLVRLE